MILNRDAAEQLIEQAGMTKMQLAAAIERPYNTLTAWFYGKRRCQPEDLMAMWRAAGMGEEWIRAQSLAHWYVPAPNGSSENE